LSGLTVIGITSLSAFTRGPACSVPSGCSAYVRISPSSAADTYTNVAAETAVVAKAAAMAAA
jgi:hypothetical protein